MSQQPAPTGREVINYDGVWGDSAEPRWYHVGDGEHRVSLGRNGVSQVVVIYALTGVGTAFLVSRLPLLGGLLDRPGWWAWALILAALFGVAAKIKPDGLPMHVYLPVVIGDLFGPRDHFGWIPCEDPDTGAWQPEELVLQEAGS